MRVPGYTYMHVPGTMHVRGGSSVQAADPIRIRVVVDVRIYAGVYEQC